ncbi:hypothetical protein [Paraburkholderia nemoris]|uniref:hypothetical protein n=1 Tax=Paraburkholderia nemoris TaxID=2793076 RepID=UPI001B0CDD50|nr:hypothetical protein [Paraburkholderia nemoris]CAE6838580.1 hypothetical protein R75777_06956 [Paraburkholderia nemoris]
MAQPIQDIWKRFEDLIEKADDPNIKLLIEALKVHAELTNLRLGGLPHEIAAILGRQPK